MNHGKIFLYSYDMTLVISETSWEEVYQIAEADMCYINEGFLKHNFKLNFNKTKYISFTQDKS